MQAPLPSPEPPLLVACLCAQWCGTCRDYRAPFDQLALKFPDARFLWIDVEDQSDLVDPIEVENFPTVLLALGSQPKFFGPITPHIDTLRRLIETVETQHCVGTADTTELDQLVARLQRAGN